MKSIIAVLGLLVLASCARDKELTIFRPADVVVIEPPDGLFQCPSAPEFPAGDFDDRAVSLLIVQLHERGEICASSLAAIRAYIAEAKAIHARKDSPKPEPQTAPVTKTIFDMLKSVEPADVPDSKN